MNSLMDYTKVILKVGYIHITQITVSDTKLQWMLYPMYDVSIHVNGLIS